MKGLNGIKATATILLLFPLAALSQTNCATTSLARLPGKWVWKQGGNNSQWKTGEPLRKELQRVFPVAPLGLEVTNSIAFSAGKAIPYTKSPLAYEHFLMAKDYECLQQYNKIQPEGETGCWAYFVVNSFEGERFPLPDQGNNILFHEYPSKIRVTNIELQTDAAGNRVIYTSWRPGEVVKHAYYFSARKDFPLRKLTNKELFAAYKAHHEKRVKEQVEKFEKLLAGDQEKYNRLSATEKQQQSYWPETIKKDKEYLEKYQAELAKINNWYAAAIRGTNLSETARVTEVNGFEFLPEKLTAPPEQGYCAWVDNPGFFDNNLPAEKPQCLSLYIRRQDGDPPKKDFMDALFSRFNLDVLYGMVGEPVKKPGGINALSASLNEAKTETAAQQQHTGPVQHSFNNTTPAQFPADWYGMKNITVQQHNNGSYLAMNKDGYWYPKQYNKEIKNGFELAFDVSWNADVAYNSGLFTVALCEMGYDNAGERYRLDDNQEMYMSLYDGYAGNFNRVVLWFDPYWNGGGTLSVYSYDKRETVIFSKRLLLPDFYKEKNEHRLTVQRRGNGLVVTDNGATIADLPGVFLPAAKYNLCTFSRYKGVNSDNKNDVFYLGEISISY